MERAPRTEASRVLTHGDRRRLQLEQERFAQDAAAAIGEFAPDVAVDDQPPRARRGVGEPRVGTCNLSECDGVDDQIAGGRVADSTHRPVSVP